MSHAGSLPGIVGLLETCPFAATGTCILKITIANCIPATDPRSSILWMSGWDLRAWLSEAAGMLSFCNKLMSWCLCSNFVSWVGLSQVHSREDAEKLVRQRHHVVVGHLGSEVMPATNRVRRPGTAELWDAVPGMSRAWRHCRTRSVGCASGGRLTSRWPRINRSKPYKLSNSNARTDRTGPIVWVRRQPVDLASRPADPWNL